MAAEDTNYTIPIREFIASKQASLFQALKQAGLSGQLVLKDPKGREWSFYLYMGRIVYATGGTHRVRRWKRNVSLHLPQVASMVSGKQRLLEEIPADRFQICWEYELLSLWIEKGNINRQQLTRMIRGVLEEILFDLTQAGQVTYQLKPDKLLSKQLVLIDAEPVIVATWKLWQAWIGAKLIDRSPNLAAVIREPEKLRSRTSPKTYQALNKLLDGQRSLRDLAVQIKRDLLPLTRSLMPYIKLELLELVEIPDLPDPVLLPKQKQVPQPSQPKERTEPLIACIDDSPVICRIMNKIVTSAGYQFISEKDPVRAMAMVLARQPNFIFIDLVMPNLNGYELCGQLRKLSIFSDTPIVIFTGNINILDRVRGKLVGATDFIIKPVHPENVLGVLTKHLKQSDPPSSNE